MVRREVVDRLMKILIIIICIRVPERSAVGHQGDSLPYLNADTKL